MYGLCMQGVTRLVMFAEGVTINSHKGVTLLVDFRRGYPLSNFLGGVMHLVNYLDNGFFKS